MSKTDFRLIDTNLPADELLDKLANEYNRNATQLQSVLGGGITSANQRCHVIELDLELSNPVSFLTTWTNSAGATHGGARYWRDSSGEVCMTGVILGGVTGTTAFNLPTGYKPDYDKSFIVSCWDSTPKSVWGRVIIAQDGRVIPFNIDPTVVNPVLEWWLDSIRFTTNEIRPPFTNLVVDIPFGTPNGVYVWKVENKAHKTYQYKGCVNPVWEPTGKSGIRILDIPGLQEGNKYKVTLIAVSG